jgi:hypothetical protein
VATGFVGPRDRTAFLPPHLPDRRDDAHFAPANHLMATIPCTRYWHHERRQQVNGLAPPGVPGWLRKFDWLVGWEHGWASTASFPRSVFCHPNALPEFTQYLAANFQSGVRPKSILAVGGEDTNLSAQSAADLETLCSYFEGVFYEAKDIPHPRIRTMICGVNEFYSRGHEDVFLELINNPAPRKNFRIVAGWGAWWPQLNETIADRVQAMSFSATSDLVDLGVWPFDDWLAKLHQAQFMLCPLGNGVQAAKMIEALLLGCIPIMTEYPASVEMKAMGVPILVVKSWSEVTPGLLEASCADLLPRIDAVRENLRDLERWWSFSFRQGGAGAAI